MVKGIEPKSYAFSTLGEAPARLHPVPTATLPFHVRLHRILLAIAAAVVGSAAAAAPPLAARPLEGAACGTLAVTRQPPHVLQHVIWIFLENKSENTVVGSHSAPFLDSLERSCGLATNYHNITHPSLPNYLSATSGDTHGLARDCSPRRCSQQGASLFTQLAAAHKTWRTYVESMPSACDHQNAGRYATKHNPPVYYATLSAACGRWDVPLEGAGGLQDALAASRLPNFSLIVPNTCDDTHSCPLAVGDAWLRPVVGMIIASPAYRSGQTAVFITWDEGGVRGAQQGEPCLQNLEDPSCHVATLVLSEYTTPGTKDASLYSHYSLLKTTEQLLGLTGRLGHAADPETLSMAAGFHL